MSARTFSCSVATIGQYLALYVADLAFVGLGLSNAMTFLNFLNELIDEPPLRAMRVLLIEQHPVHFTGVAYGPRSGSNSLLINSLEEFIGEESREEYIAWIRKNQARLFKDYERTGGELSAKWVQNFRQAEASNRTSSLCVPRHFFGFYLREQVFSTLKLATALGVVDVQAITGAVKDLSLTPIGYSLDVEGQAWSLLAEKVVLGVGPPLSRPLPHRKGVRVAQSKHIVDNPYGHSIGEMTMELARDLCQEPQRLEPVNVLVVGSNASAIESCYLLFDQPGFKERVNKVYVLSPTGKFPNRRYAPAGQIEFEAVHLGPLSEKANLKAADIYAALEMDLEIWRKRLDSDELPLFCSNKELMAAVNVLDREEKEKFAATYGVMIGKFQRRAGDDYLDMADAMEQQGKLEHIAGQFVEITSCETNSSRIDYRPAGSSEAVPFPQDLIRRGLCKVNSSERGFVVADDYSAAPNMIVTGPLIAGNVIRDQAVWHVEHGGRLTTIAKDVAAMLHRDIVETFIVAA